MSSSEVSTKDKDADRPVSYLKLFKYADTKDKLLLCLAAFFSAAQGSMMPIFAIVYGEATQDFSPSNPPEQIREAASKTALYMLLLGIGIFVFTFVGSFIWAMVGNNLQKRVRKMYFSSLINQEMGWFDVVNPEKLTISYVENMQKFSAGVGFQNHIAIYSYSIGLCGFIVAYANGWWYSIIVTITFPLIMVGMFLFVSMNQKEARMTKAAYEQAGSCSEQALYAIKTVRSMCGEEHEISIYKAALDEAKKQSIKYGFIAAFCYGLFMFCLTTSYGLNYWLGSMLVDKNITNGNKSRPYNIVDIITIFFAISNGGFALGQTSPAIRAISMAKQAAASIYQVIERKSSIPLNDPKGVVPNEIRGEIEFRNVGFSYPTRPDTTILKGASFKIPAGKKVAFVGETGCGKSTSIQLIERYYDPTVGQVLIDGIDMREYNLSALRKFVGYVGQEPVLFAMTVRENLLLARPEATEDQIKDALAQANALDFIMQLEAGIDTFVGSGGSQLSGGQKQRICIARSILQNP